MRDDLFDAEAQVRGGVVEDRGAVEQTSYAEVVGVGPFLTNVYLEAIVSRWPSVSRSCRICVAVESQGLCKRRDCQLITRARRRA